VECKVNTAAKKEYGKECYEDNDWNNGWWTLCDECFDKDQEDDYVHCCYKCKKSIDWDMTEKEYNDRDAQYLCRKCDPDCEEEE
jgi:hypothetical protein